MSHSIDLFFFLTFFNIKLETASFPKRLLAYNIDITVFMFLIVPISFLIENNRVLYIVAFLITILYFTFFESSSWQATPGKKYMNMKVVTPDEKRISVLRAFVRILSKLASIVLFFVGFAMIYLREDRRGLHDLLSGTKVVLVNYEKKMEKGGS